MRRIAYIVPGFSATENDTAIPVLRSLMREMSGYLEPVVYTLHYPQSVESYTIHGVPVHPLGGKEGRGLGRAMLWGRLRKKIRQHHAKAPYDLIHAFWATEAGVLANHIAKGLRIPSVVSIAGGELARLEGQGYGAQLRPLHRRVVRHAFAGANAITAGSPWVSHLVPERFQGKLATIPLGVDPLDFPQGPLRGQRRLLAVASVIPLKDYPTLLRGFAIAARSVPEIELDIVGYQDGAEMKGLHRLMGELGLEGRVRFHGQIPYDRIPATFRDHDLLAHSSLYEAEGMVILEALATGMPVVASDVGIAASLPEDLVYRFLPGDADGLARQIVRSLASGEHAERALARGPVVVDEEYTMEQTAEMFIELYEGL
jgi:glycosyltransferase involved in cell wall biosynthesis